ncbi:MAG: hemolysin family protein [Cyclobacteriaceae bacterium]
METTYLVIILITILFSAFFSGIEIAFISADKLQIELDRSQKLLSGNILSGFLDRPSWFISTTLIGNNIALVVYGIFMAFVLEPIIEGWLTPKYATDVSILLCQTVISTLIVLVTAEFTPKSIFLINPNKMLNIFAVPLYILYIILFPIVFLTVWLSRFFIVNLLGKDYSEDKPVYRLTDLNQFLKKRLQGTNDDKQEGLSTRIFSNALEFKTIMVRECMVPRTDLVVVDIEEDIIELKNAFIESGYSKILVYRDSIDEIIGYCRSVEMFKKPKQISEVLQPITIVPETMLANELMVQFITERKSIALVVDEFGGTAGIVTIEDIIEEIFGEIQDEHDDEEWEENKIDDKTFIFSARNEVDYLNDKYGWDLPDGDYDTLGGLILSITEDMPEENDEILVAPYRFTILSIDENKIERVKMHIEEIESET